MSLPDPPSDAGDAELWLAGYELRTAHLPIDGSAECPICHTHWECAAYRTGAEMMRAATDGPPSPPEDRRPGTSGTSTSGLGRTGTRARDGGR